MNINTGFYPFAVLYALFLVILALGYYKTKDRNPNYFLNLGYYVDMLGNALLAGNPVITVSARSGLNALKARRGSITGLAAKYWLSCERVINWAFKPIDGPNHCRDAYEWTKGVFPNENIHKGPIILFGLGLPAIALVCAILRPITWLIARYTN